jgi:uncharacterized delta-60 repeat protein
VPPYTLSLGSFDALQDRLVSRWLSDRAFSSPRMRHRGALLRHVLRTAARAVDRGIPMSLSSVAMRRFARALAVLTVAVPTVANAAGELDPTFGNSGTVELFDNPGKAYAIARDAQGNLFVAGIVGNPGSQDFSVVKLDAFGRPAQDFGDAGRATIDLGGDDVAYSVAINAAGEIFLGGVTKIGTTTGFDFAVVKLDAAGRRVASFADNGAAIVDFGPGNNDYGQSIRVLPNGSIFLVGATNHSSSDVRYDFAIMKLDLAGHLDGSFGSGGRAQFEVGCCDDYGYAVASDANGNVYIAGTSYTNTPGVSALGLIKVRPDGSLDPSFGDDGRAFASIGDSNFGFGLARATDGTLYVAGQVGDGINPWHFGVAAFDASGHAAAFGDDGVTAIDFGTDLTEYPAAIAVDADKHLYLAGSVVVDGEYRFAAATLDAGGSLVPNFGSGGTLILDALGGSAFAYATLIDPAGGLYLAGMSNATLARSGDAPDVDGPTFAVAKLRVDRTNIVLLNGFDTP